jgi:hypothetical protein
MKVDSAMSSASHDDLAIMDCFLEAKNIGQWHRKMMAPE